MGDCHWYTKSRERMRIGREERILTQHTNHTHTLLTTQINQNLNNKPKLDPDDPYNVTKVKQRLIEEGECVSDESPLPTFLFPFFFGLFLFYSLSLSLSFSLSFSVQTEIPHIEEFDYLRCDTHVNLFCQVFVVWLSFCLYSFLPLLCLHISHSLTHTHAFVFSKSLPVSLRETSTPRPYQKRAAYSLFWGGKVHAFFSFFLFFLFLSLSLSFSLSLCVCVCVCMRVFQARVYSLICFCVRLILGF